MSLLSPVSELSRGFRTFPQGVAWLRAHPRYMAMLTIPWILGFVGLVGGITFLLTHGEGLVATFLFARPPTEEWGMLVVYFVCRALLYLALAILDMVGALLLMNIAAAPIYEAISVAVEREVTGREPPSLGIRGNLMLMLTEFQKVLLIFFVSVVMLLIPGVNVVSALLSAFLVGWDFYDYPLARRGWTLKRRLTFVSGDGWAVLGFGIWLVIPFVQLALMPLAVAGGTLLNLESLKRRETELLKGR